MQVRSRRKPVAMVCPGRAECPLLRVGERCFGGEGREREALPFPRRFWLSASIRAAQL